MFPVAEASNIMPFFAEYSTTIPDELYADLGLISAPGGEGDFVLMHVCYSGPEKHASKWVDPIRNAGTTLTCVS